MFGNPARSRLLPMSVPFRYFGAAVVFQLAAWGLLLSSAGDLSGFEGGLGPVFASLHLATLGTFTVGYDSLLKITRTISSPAYSGYFTPLLVKNGSGTLELSGSNTYQGGLWMQQGKLKVATSGGLAPGSVLLVYAQNTATNPIVEIPSGVNPSIGGLVVNRGTITGAGGLTITGATLQDVFIALTGRELRE